MPSVTGKATKFRKLIRNPKAAAAPTPREPRVRDPLAKLRKQLDTVEQQIAQLAKERNLLDGQSADDEASRRRRANLERDTAMLETQWMEIGTAIEAAEEGRSV